MADNPHREGWIDAWRGMLIVLVVLGHAMGAVASRLSADDRGLMDVCCHYIYYFHVPAFFALSGLLWKRRNDGFLHFAGKRFVRLMVPYYCFGILSILVYMGVARFVTHDAAMSFGDCVLGLLHGGGWPGDNGLKFNSPLWFFPCLWVSELVYYWIDRCFPKTWVQLALLVPVMYIENRMAAYGLSKLPMGLSIVPRAVIFMILARAIVPKGQLVQRNGWVMAWLLGAVLLFVLASHLRLEWNPIAWLRGPQLFSQVFACICASAVFAQVFACRDLARLGSATVGVLCAHKFVIVGVMPFCTAIVVRGGALQMVVAAVMSAWAIALSLAVQYVARRLCPFVVGEMPCRAVSGGVS